MVLHGMDETGSAQIAVYGIVFSHALENHEFVQDVDGLNEIKHRFEVSEVQRFKNHVFQLSFVSGLVRHDFHADIQKLVLLNTLFRSGGKHPSVSRHAQHHPFIEIEEIIFIGILA